MCGAWAPEDSLVLGEGWWRVFLLFLPTPPPPLLLLPVPPTPHPFTPPGFSKDFTSCLLILSCKQGPSALRCLVGGVLVFTVQAARGPFGWTMWHVWDHLGCCVLPGVLWIIWVYHLGCCGPSGVPSGMLWTIWDVVDHLGCCGPSGMLWTIWDVVDHLGCCGLSGMLWTIWVYHVGVLWTIWVYHLGCCGLSGCTIWGVVDHLVYHLGCCGLSGMLWTVWGFKDLLVGLNTLG